MRLVLVFLGLLAAPLQAGLLDEFGGSTEAEIAAKFEQQLPAFLKQRFDADKSSLPRIFVDSGKESQLLQVVGVEGDKSTWQPLVKAAWFPEKNDYQLGVFGPTRELTTSQIEPAQVALWFDAGTRTPAEMIGLAVWAGSRGDLMVANAKLAETAGARPSMREAIEEWLSAKHGWTRPAGGLTLVQTHDLDRNLDSALLLTPEANEARLRELDKQAKTEFKQLEELQGDDVKSKPGQRKRSPQIRLDLLVQQAERFKRAFAGTKFIESGRNVEKIDKIIETAKADIAFIDEAQYQADRFGIDNDWKACAKAWDELLRVDPINDTWIKKTAEAHSKASAMYEGGRKSEFPDHARRAAELYEQLIAMYPRAIAWLNFAGTNWLPAGDKARAKARFEEVLDRTAKDKELDANEQKNREYAENMLKLCK